MEGSAIVQVINLKNPGDFVPLGFYCKEKDTMEKVVWMMELKEEKVDDYIKVHRKENVWPEVIEVNKKAGVLKEEIFLFKNFVFIYLEVENYEKMMKVFEEDEGLKKWNQITLPMTKSKPELKEVMKRLDIIFDYENGKLLH